MTSVVLDASAVIAVLREEPGADIVEAALSDAIMSTVNYSEVLKKAIERGGTGESAASFVRGLSIAVIPFDTSVAAIAAELYPLGKPYGMSFADRACLALGIHCKCKVLTSERKMAKVKVPVNVTLIRNEH